MKKASKSTYHSRRAFIAIVLTSLLLMVAAVAICLWHQPLWKFDRPIDTSKLADCFNAIGAVATAGALAGLIVQMSDARRSRNLDFQPYLHPQPITITVAIYDMENTDPIQRMVVVRNDTGKLPGRLTLKNIGNHLAREISVSWEYEKSQMQSYVAEEYENVIDWQETDMEPEMIGALATGEFVEVSLPEYYCASCAPKLNNPRVTLSDEQVAKPILSLRLRYENILGVSFDFRMPVEISAFRNFAGFSFPRASAEVKK